MKKPKSNLLKKAAYIFVGFVFCVLALLAIVHKTAMRNFITPKLEEMALEQEKHSDAILADLKTLEKAPLFKATAYKSNAEPFLSEHVSWTGDGFTPFETTSHQNLRSFFKTQIKWEDKKQLEQRSKDPILNSIDVDWMNNLNKFDHWNFSSHANVQNKIKSVAFKNGISRIGTFATLPIPDFTELRNFAVVYYLKSYRDGHPQEGLQVLRQVANLMHSTGTLVSQMSAVAVLKTTRKISLELKLNSELNAMDDQIAAYKRVSWAWVSILTTPWYGRWNPKFEQYLKPEFGMCAGSYEQIITLEGLKEFLEPQFPFEESFVENYQRQRPFQKRLMDLCHFRDYDAFSADVPTDAQHFLSREPALFAPATLEKPTASLTINYARIPYVRRTVGLTILTMASPNWTRGYDELNQH